MKPVFCLLCVLLLALPSCMSTRTPVAGYQVAEGDEICYAKGRQMYLFWGLIPLGRTRVATPPDGVCEVRTRYGFWDAFVSLITAGIFEMQQVRVYTKKKPAQVSAQTAKETNVVVNVNQQQTNTNAVPATTLQSLAE